MINLVTFSEQLEMYPQLKEMITKKPKEPPVPPVSPPWRIYGRRDDASRWGYKDFWTYKEAFLFFKVRWKSWHDISITSKRQSYDPPGRVVKIKRNGQPVMVKTATGTRQMTKLVPIKPPPGHLWCMYCRRMTVFKYFTKHHAPGLRRLPIDGGVRRCCICGISETTGAHR